MRVPDLHTPRLTIRELRLTDLESVHAALNAAWGEDEPVEARRTWLEWTVRSYSELANLHQPPYGERAIVLRESGALIGAVGLVPSFGPWEQLPSLGGAPPEPLTCTPAFGLYWAVSPNYQGQGLATEAARALIVWARSELHVGRIVATTTNANLASQAVMRKLGMRLERNPWPEPPWFETVGILDP
ncbi:MAG: GNAT family N-acetyltransferase [Dehalococcoidia bacterium]